MISTWKLYSVLCGVLALPVSRSLEPISSTIGVLGALTLSAAYAGYEYGKCKLYECCDDKWIKLDVTGMRSSLKHSLHGQHLVEHIVVNQVKGHVQAVNPSKALVMSFNGWTGSGKNHVSKIIAENLYLNGMRSLYVHLYIATQHFYDHTKVEQYKVKLKNDIEKHTKACGRSLFIFDELDKMPPGIIDAIKPYIDYHDQVDGVDYRQNIFIFLSNAGGSEITKVAFDVWLADQRREDITMKDVESLIHKGVFNERGGLQHSEIIKHALVDVYVPFLPLEKKHVILCILDILRSRKPPLTLSKEMLETIAEQLEYSPPEFLLYSVSGCKRLAQKVNLYSDD